MEWSKLYPGGWGARRALGKAIRKSVGVGKPVKWWREDGAKVQARNPRGAAKAIVIDAKTRQMTNTYHTSASVPFRVLIGNPPNLAIGIPSAALPTQATKLTLAAAQEVALVFPDYKSLGLYVPKTLTDDHSYYSEHAWAAAFDVGMDNGHGAYETNPVKLTPFLASVSAYLGANFARLRINEYIYDRVAREASGPSFVERPYTGSDPHQTHIHAQFADHGGVKPPWL
jgi:hypothetical protein